MHTVLYSLTYGTSPKAANINNTSDQLLFTSADTIGTAAPSIGGKSNCTAAITIATSKSILRDVEITKFFTAKVTDSKFTLPGLTITLDLNCS